jgi:hypothetical protein
VADIRYACGLGGFGSSSGERDNPCYFIPFGTSLVPLNQQAVFDATDAYMRAAGQDPYRFQQQRFLEEQRALRLRQVVPP